MEPAKPRTLDLQRAEIIKALLEEFHDKEYREGYVEDFYNAKIATQINVLRNQQKLSQKELGELAGMAQERISVLEDVNYNRWTLNVLRRLGEAFGLVVDVEFKEYGEFIKEFNSFGPDRLQKRSFDEDPLFRHLDAPIDTEPAAEAVPGLVMDATNRELELLKNSQEITNAPLKFDLPDNTLSSLVAWSNQHGTVSNNKLEIGNVHDATVTV